MSIKIGFIKEESKNTYTQENYTTNQQMPVARKSVVQVYFPERCASYAYYNDQFDLKQGDIVYVDGKLEGLQGRVTDVNHNFKIKISEYKRVIAVADTEVHGQFFLADSHFVTFDPSTLPSHKVVTWFKAPTKEEDEFVSGSDEETFSLDNLADMNISNYIVDRGHDYYLDNKVRYISIDGTSGYAIVEGSKPYEVEFEYRNREISSLVCSCFCSYNCKHEFAVMLQLRETLELIEKNYADEYARTGYFAAVSKGTLFAFAVAGRETGKLEL